jgi:hypothetical protein
MIIVRGGKSRTTAPLKLTPELVQMFFSREREPQMSTNYLNYSKFRPVERAKINKLLTGSSVRNE